MRVLVNIQTVSKAETSTELLDFTVSPTDTVSAVKERLAAGAQRANFPDQSLLLDGTVLADQLRLCECGIKDSCSLDFVVKASEECLVKQCAELLQQRELTQEELALLYCYKYGVSLGQTLKSVGYDGDMGDFLRSASKSSLSLNADPSQEKDDGNVGVEEKHSGTDDYDEWLKDYAGSFHADSDEEENLSQSGGDFSRSVTKSSDSSLSTNAGASQQNDDDNVGVEEEQSGTDDYEEWLKDFAGSVHADSDDEEELSQPGGDSPRVASKSADSSLSTNSGESQENDDVNGGVEEEQSGTDDEQSGTDYEDWLKDFAGSFQADSDDEEEEEAEATNEQGAAYNDGSKTLCNDDPPKIVEEKDVGTAAVFAGQNTCFLQHMRGAASPIKKVVLSPDVAVGGSAHLRSLGQAARARPPAAALCTLPSESSASTSSSTASTRTSAGTATPGVQLGDGSLRCTRAERDTRPPVVDDYDVCKATSEYAKQRQGDHGRQQREDLKASIAQRREQVRHLDGKSNKSINTSMSSGLPIAPDVRAHYSAICDELLEEIHALEMQLFDLEHANVSDDPAEWVDCGALSEQTIALHASHMPRRPRAEALEDEGKADLKLLEKEKTCRGDDGRAAFVPEDVGFFGALLFF